MLEVGRSGFSVDSADVTSITSGATKGSVVITVADASLFSVGSYVLVDQLNDPSFVTEFGWGGESTSVSRENGDRALGQMNKIVGKSGGNLRALEVILAAVGSKLGRKAAIEIVE